jgi:hypothetical protein
VGSERQLFVLPRRSTFRPNGGALANLVRALRRDGWLSDPASAAHERLDFTTMKPHRIAQATGAYVALPADLRARVTLSSESFFPLPTAERLDAWFRSRETGDLAVVWPMVGAIDGDQVEGFLRYPLSAAPQGVDIAEWELSLWLADDFIYQGSDEVAPFADETCAACGASLVTDPESERLLFHARRLRARCGACGAPFDPSTRSAALLDGRGRTIGELRGGMAFRFALVIECGECFPDGKLRLHDRLRSLLEATLGQSFYEVDKTH